MNNTTLPAPIPPANPLFNMMPEIILLLLVIGVVMWLSKRGAKPSTELPPNAPQPPTGSFHNKAASFSLLTPFVVVIVSFFAGSFIPYFMQTRADQQNHPALMIVLGLFALCVLLLPIVGFVFGIIALLASKKTGVFWKPFFGTGLNLLIILVSVMIAVNGIKHAQGTMQAPQAEQRQ